MITPTISESAREAASQERVHEDWICGMREDYPAEKVNLPVGHHVQLAIDKATASLTQENERLKKLIKEGDGFEMAGFDAGTKLRISSLEKQITGLRAALEPISHIPNWYPGEDNQSYWIGGKHPQEIAKDALSTPDFSKQFVKRETYYAVLKFTHHAGSCHMPDACTCGLKELVAKAELEGGK